MIKETDDKILIQVIFIVTCYGMYELVFLLKRNGRVYVCHVEVTVKRFFEDCN